MTQEHSDQAVRGLQALRVVLGIDSPETRGWAPALQQEARRALDRALDALAQGSEMRALAESEGSRAVAYLRRTRRTEAVLRTLVDLCDRVDLDRPTFGDCAALRSAREVLDRSEHDACTWPSCKCNRAPTSACALGFTVQAVDNEECGACQGDGTESDGTPCTYCNGSGLMTPNVI